MTLPDNYDVEEAARLLRWVGLLARSRAAWEQAGKPDEWDAYLTGCFIEVTEFLDAICPTCHGAGDYFIAEDEREPCDDCGMWMRAGVAVTTEAF